MRMQSGAEIARRNVIEMESNKLLKIFVYFKIEIF